MLSLASCVRRLMLGDGLAAALERGERLRAAVEWALGARGDFRARNEKIEGPYWWRKELLDRAGLKWDGEKFIDA